MRSPLKLFPPGWRNRYGDEFLEQYDSDPRRMTKWVDIARTAAGLRWHSFRASRDSVALGLVGALSLAVGCDAALGIGMDERIEVDILEHWWGAPFAAVLALSATLATGCVVALLGERRRRRSLIVLTAAIGTGSIAGSALFAAVSFDLAAAGAGIGLAVAMTATRGLLASPLGRGDALLVAAVPMILVLGARSASSPGGPLILVVLAAALVSTRGQAHFDSQHTVWKASSATS